MTYNGYFQAIFTFLIVTATGVNLAGAANLPCPTTSYPASLQEKSLRSPGYPNGYARNTKVCYWFYTPSATEQSVILRIANLRMPSSSPCEFEDYVKIYDGSTMYTPKLGTLCGNMTNVTIESTGRHLLLYFSTDGDTDDNEAGFLLYYRYISLNDLIGQRCDSATYYQRASPYQRRLQSFGYPDGYSNNTKKCYEFSAPSSPKGNVILHIADLRMPYRDPCTSADYVRIYDGRNTTASTLRTLCGTRTNITIKSTGRYLLLYFNTDSWISSSTEGGFLLYYNYELDQTCSSTVNYAAPKWQGYVRSPGYPDGYDLNLRKCYRFYTPSSTEEIVFLRIVRLGMPMSSPCISGDYIIVYDGSNQTASTLRTLCGNVTDITITSTGRYLLLFFSTDNTTDTYQAGFLLSYRYVSTRLIRPCPSVHSYSASTSKKELTSPEYPSATGAYMTYCWLLITDQQYQKVHVKVLETSMAEPVNGTCVRNDFVEGREGNSSSSTLLQRWCGSQTVVFSSEGRYLFLRFQTGSSGNTAASFRLQYWAEDISAIADSPNISIIADFPISGIVGFVFLSIFILSVISACFKGRHHLRRRFGSGVSVQAGVAVDNVNDISTAHASSQPVYRSQQVEYPPQSYPQPSQTSPQYHIAYPRSGSPSPSHSTSQLSDNRQCSQMAPQYNPPQSYPQPSQMISQYHTGYPLPGSPFPYGQCSQMVPQNSQLPEFPANLPSAPPPPYSSLFPVSTEPGCYDNGQAERSFPPPKGHVPQP